jgi:hypothetical protein
VNYRELFAEVRQRPGMFGVEGSYRSLCAFVLGVNAGNGWALLLGFQEFLVTRLGYGDNLFWSALVSHLAFPGSDRDRHAVLDEPGYDEIASATLFQLLDEFLERRSRGGHIAIIAEYLAWRQEHPGRNIHGRS